uniref:Uncharacterized protein n=2 Tax=Ostreococcus mediterraneus TaxID=1486918 RepID=A0A7S0KGL8_9CHLO
MAHGAIDDVIDDRARALYVSAYERIDRDRGGGGAKLGVPRDGDGDGDGGASARGVFVVNIARDVRAATLHGTVMRVGEGGELARGGDARLADAGSSSGTYAYDINVGGKGKGDGKASLLTRARVRCLRELAITRTLESVRDEYEREAAKARTKETNDGGDDDDDARARKRERKEKKEKKEKSAKKAKKDAS